MHAIHQYVVSSTLLPVNPRVCSTQLSHHIIMAIIIMISRLHASSPSLPALPPPSGPLCAPQGLQYFYVTYLTILLFDRAIRDDHRCSQKCVRRTKRHNAA